MKVLITGGTSYLGQHMVPYFVNTGHEVVYTWRSTALELDGMAVQLDIRNENAVEQAVVSAAPDGVIHLAASNRSESEAAMTSSIIDGAHNITRICKQHQIRLIHMSTDVVFDGTAAPYDEGDVKNPVHAYGKAKAAAEEIVLTHNNSVVVRPSLIYGLKVKDRSTEWIESALQADQPVTLFTDQIRNPVWVDTLSSACLELLTHSFSGVIHIVGSQVLSRAEFGVRMLDFWGIKKRDALSFAPTPKQLNWPPDLRLNTSRAKSLLNTPMLGVDEVLRL